jgi:hypothetical protein
MRVEFAGIGGQHGFLHRHGFVHGRDSNEYDGNRELDGDGLFEHRRQRGELDRRLKQ